MPGIVCDICGQNEMEPVDGEPNMYKCAYCGTKYTKEQLQERLVKIDGPIKVEGVQDFDKLLENGKTFLNLGELQKAYDVFVKLTNEYPSKYESWYGYVKTCIERGETTDKKIKTAKQVANDLEKMQILQDLKVTASKFESEGDFKKAIRVHEVITEGYPEIYLSWYDYVKCNLQLDHVSSDEFQKAVEIANEQENNLMISELMQIVKNLENDQNYEKSSRVYELLIEAFPEKAVGYYGYIRESSKLFREYNDNNNFDERLLMALELSKQEENQTYINDLETYEQIKQNIFEIRKAQADVQSYIEDKNDKLNKASADYLREKNSRESKTNEIKYKSNSEINELKKTIGNNKIEINSVVNSKPRGFKNTIWKGPLGLILGILAMLLIIVVYWKWTFGSGSVGMGFVGVFLIAIPFWIITILWGFCSDCSNSIKKVSSANSRVKQLQKINDKSQKKIDKLTTNMNNKVNSKNETDSAELKAFAEKRDKEQEDINKEAETKVSQKEEEINGLKAKNEELFTKISA